MINRQTANKYIALLMDKQKDALSGESMKEHLEELKAFINDNDYYGIAVDRCLERNYLVNTLNVIKKYSIIRFLKWRNKRSVHVEELSEVDFNKSDEPLGAIELYQKELERITKLNDELFESCSMYQDILQEYRVIGKLDDN